LFAIVAFSDLAALKMISFYENTAIVSCKEESMRRCSIVASVGFVALSGFGSAQAQTAPVQGTPGSPFPYASRHEVQIINGVPCRTMYDRQFNTRVPIACAGNVPVHRVEVATTGSTGSGTSAGVPIAGTPGFLFPYARPNEIRMINGVPCRTMYDRQFQTRIPVACAGEVAAYRVN
jgi:hypothetical protein